MVTESPRNGGVMWAIRGPSAANRRIRKQRGIQGIIDSNSILGEKRVVIEKDAHIENSVIEDCVAIGSKALVKNSHRTLYIHRRR